MCDFNFILDMGFSLKSNSRLQQQPFYSRKFGSFIIPVSDLFIFYNCGSSSQFQTKKLVGYRVIVNATRALTFLNCRGQRCAPEHG